MRHKHRLFQKTVALSNQLTDNRLLFKFTLVMYHVIRSCALIDNLILNKCNGLHIGAN